MRYAFVAEHRGQFSVRAMCRCLRIQPSGVLCSLQAPLSARAQEDRRQTELLQKAWAERARSTDTASCMTIWSNRATREDARQDVFDYIEMFYNPKRKQARNGMLSPAEFERQQKMRREGV